MCMIKYQHKGCLVILVCLFVCFFWGGGLRFRMNHQQIGCLFFSLRCLLEVCNSPGSQ